MTNDTKAGSDELASTALSDIRCSVNDPLLGRRYEQYGVVLVENIIPQGLITRYRADVASLCAARLTSLGREPSAPENLDTTFSELAAVERRHGGEVFDVARGFDSFQDLVRCLPATAMVEQLGSPRLRFMPQAAAIIHVTLPFEDTYLFPWHQDYTYNVLGLGAVSVWLPLTDITPEIGPLAVVPGSHRMGIAPLREIRPLDSVGKGKGAGRRIYEYANVDTERLEAHAIEVPMKATDCLFFHSLLWHRSGKIEQTAHGGQ